ncbi:MAG: hypothetical protein QM606_02470 [Leucobacter sp.]
MSLEHELRRIREMPYGVARTAAAEAARRRIEADGSTERLAEALIDLVEAHVFTGEPAKASEVFAELLRVWDEAPGLFDPSDRRNLFWEYKWIAVDLPDDPEIAPARAEAVLADMERRFALAGHGLSSVRMSRFHWAWRTGAADAEAARLTWVAGPRDDFDDCRACTIGQQVDFFTDTGRYPEAVRLALTQDADCNLEPARTRYALALSALLEGDETLAGAALRQAVSCDDGDATDFGPARGQGFEALARGGDLERALRRLRNDHPGLLRRAASPLARLRFLLGVLAGLSANLDLGDSPTGLHEAGWRTVRELHGWVLAEAERLAARFDARNGNGAYAERLARALRASRAPRPLPSGTDARARGDGSGAGAASASPDRTISGPAFAVSLFQRAEAVLAGRDYAAAAASYLDAARAAEAEGLVSETGLALAEAAQCAAADGDDAAAHERFGEAVPRLLSGEADPDICASVLAAWAPIAARMADPAAQITATAAALADCERLDPVGLDDEPAARLLPDLRRRRAILRDTLARSIAAADPVVLETLPERGLGHLDASRAATEALAAGEEFAGLGLLSDAAHAFWLAGRVQRGIGDPDAAAWALESAVEGFTAARMREQRVRAAGDLIELLRETGRSDQAEEIASRLAR